MTDESTGIKIRIAEVLKRQDKARAEHKREMMILESEIKLIQLDCPHTEKRERWIMGRELVTECKACDKEF